MRASTFLLFLAACGGGTTTRPTPEEPPPGPALRCVEAGCSGTLCVDAGGEQVVTTCEFRPEYACYQAATCEPQPDATCGWTPTPELTACLADPPPM